MRSSLILYGYDDVINQSVPEDMVNASGDELGGEEEKLSNASRNSFINLQ